MFEWICFNCFFVLEIIIIYLFIINTFQNMF